MQKHEQVNFEAMYMWAALIFILFAVLATFKNEFTNAALFFTFAALLGGTVQRSPVWMSLLSVGSLALSIFFWSYSVFFHH